MDIDPVGHLCRRAKQDPQGLRFTTLCAAGALVLTIIAPDRAALAQDTASGFCDLTDKSRALVRKVERQQGAEPWLSVERGSDIQAVAAGCFLQSGDIVRPGAGMSAEIQMPDNSSQPVTFPAVIKIPEVAVPSEFGRLMAFFGEFIGQDWQSARDDAAAVIGDTRSGDPSTYLVMPGGHDIGHQSVDGSHPLYLRWAGSAPPYAVSILRLPDDTDTPEISVTTSELHTELDLSHLPAGEYSLNVKGRNRLELTLPFAVVKHADVPAFKSGAADLAASPEYRIEQAIFLLRRPDTSWRVEAISQLLALSAEGNFFAKALVGVENTVKRP